MTVIGNGDTPMKSAFWMVYGDQQRAPTYKHDTADAARLEAARLAELHPGIAFYVLKAKSGVMTAKPVATEWPLTKRKPDPDDGIPF